MNDHTILVQTGPRKSDVESFGLRGKVVVGTTVALRYLLGKSNKEAYAHCLAQGWEMRRLGGDVE